MKGRPRKPTAVLEATGAFRKNPQRAAARANEPKPNGPIGKPPAYFDAAHKKVWKELVGESQRGVLTKADRKHLELTTRLTCRMRVVPGRMTKALNFLGDALITLGMDKAEVAEFKTDIRKTLGCSAQELSLLSTCLQRMGMTPADRSKVYGEPEEKPVDPFDKVLEALTTQKRVQ